MEIFFNLPLPEREENYIHYNRYVYFIKSRPNRDIKKEKGFNIHHILPKSMGGDSEKINLIKLTHREHFIAHMLLFYCSYTPMISAFWLLCNCNIGSLTARQYENLKEKMSTFNPYANKSEEERAIMKQKVSDFHKEKTFSNDYRRKLSEAAKGKHKTEQHRKNLAIALIGKKQSKETIQKRIQKNTGKKRSDATKEKMSKANVGQKNPSAKRVKCLETNQIFSFMGEGALLLYGNTEFYRYIAQSIKTKKPVKGYTWVLC